MLQNVTSQLSVLSLQLGNRSFPMASLCNTLAQFNQLKELQLNFSNNQLLQESDYVLVDKIIDGQLQLQQLDLNLNRTALKEKCLLQLFKTIQKKSAFLMKLTLNLFFTNINYALLVPGYQEMAHALARLTSCIIFFPMADQLQKMQREKVSVRQKLIYSCMSMKQSTLKRLFRKEITWEILEFIIDQYNTQLRLILCQ